MPIYPYVCTACGHEFDALQKVSDDPLTDCPECGEPRLRKRLSAPAFQLKGTGWYETDFKHGGRKKQSGEGGKADKDKESGADKKDGAGKSKDDSKGSSGSGSKPAAAAGGKDD